MYEKKTCKRTIDYGCIYSHPPFDDLAFFRNYFRRRNDASAINVFLLLWTSTCFLRTQAVELLALVYSRNPPHIFAKTSAVIFTREAIRY